ncbi:MAG: GDP-mannose 4,6-dehydratase, partial [Planctomycetota bacterium]
MWLMLQQPAPDDYVLATGQEHTIRQLLSIAFDRVGLDWQNYVREEQRFMRPADACGLLGNATKARTRLGWQQSLTFQELIHLMVDHDVRLVAEKPAVS